MSNSLTGRKLSQSFKSGNYFNISPTLEVKVRLKTFDSLDEKFEEDEELENDVAIKLYDQEEIIPQKTIDKTNESGFFNISLNEKIKFAFDLPTMEKYITGILFYLVFYY